MDNERLIKKFRDKLEDDFRSIKYFHKKFLRGKKYNTLIQELNGFIDLSDEAKAAIKMYLKTEGDSSAQS